ncbi:MAG: DUF4270 family protein [Bacteroidota bacterium]
MNKKFATWLSAIFGAAMLFLTACQEDSGFFNDDILPAEDVVRTVYNDSLVVEFSSIWVDSSETYRSTRQMFGNYIDPLFGRITTETYTEVLPRSNLNFGDTEDLIFDSLVLRLDVESSYGRVSTIQKLLLFELTEGFPDDDEIRSTTSINYDDSQNLAQSTVLNLEVSKGAEELRIRLNDDLGKRILFADPDSLEDKDLFQELFHGFFIGTEPVTYLSREPGAIFTLNSASTATQMELYYKKRETGTQTFVSLIEPFPITGSTPRFTRIQRTEVSDKLLNAELPQPDTAQQLEFIQGGALVKNFVRIPDLSSLGQVAINQAELVIFVDQNTLGSSNRYNPPPQLLPIFADEDGVEVDIDGTFVLASAEAAYDATTGTYSISLTNYVQQLVNEQRENYGIILRPNGSDFRVNRAVFGGTNHPTLQPALRITYTTLPK